MYNLDFSETIMQAILILPWDKYIMQLFCDQKIINILYWTTKKCYWRHVPSPKTRYTNRTVYYGFLLIIVTTVQKLVILHIPQAPFYYFCVSLETKSKQPKVLINDLIRYVVKLLLYSNITANILQVFELSI